MTGRLRMRWLALCVLTALPVLALTMGATLLLPSDGGEAESQWVGWPAFGRALAVLLVLVPLQAAAEEYVFRGWLTQTAGAFLRSPWAALVPQAVLFASAHGWGTPWGFADLLVFGACAGWLTWRTGDWRRPSPCTPSTTSLPSVCRPPWWTGSPVTRPRPTRAGRRSCSTSRASCCTRRP
ncbi:CPBP family intramembrane glutamic endopeptidase [Streptomyces nogalater]